MRNHPTSTADIIGTAKAILSGAASNADPVQKYSLDTKTLSDLLDRFVELDAKQEKDKADLHQASADLWTLRRKLQAEFGRWISVMEGQLGKNNDKLQEFGIAPRNLRPHKGPRTKATPNTPANNNAPGTNKTSANNNQPANGTPATNNPPAQPQVEA